MRTNWLFALLFAAAFGLFGCKKMPLEKIDTPEKLEKRLAELQAKSLIPGLAVAVVRGDSIVFSKGFGVADRVSKTPYTPQTIQPVGSVSKTIVAFSLQKAAEMGLFSLDDALDGLLPFAVRNPKFPDDPITLRQLATHTSGIVDNPIFYRQSYELGKTPTVSLGDFLKKYCSPGGAFYAAENFGAQKPGAEFNYSNIGSALAALAVEARTGEPFDVFVQKNLFGPLGMADSHWFFDDAKAARYATLYEVIAQSDPIYQQLLNADGSLKTYCLRTWPDGGLRTTAADLTRFLIEMMRGQSKMGGSVLTDASFSALFSEQFSAATMPANMLEKEPNRAIFWAFTRTGRLSHTGGDPGLAAFLSFDPAKKTGRVVLVNANLDGDDNVQLVEQFQEMGAAIAEFESSF